MAEKHPYVDAGLVEYLEATFPNALPPTIDFSVHEVAYGIGVQKVITHLKQLAEWQSKREATT